PNYTTINFIDEVSTSSPYQWSQGGRQAAPQTELVFSEGPRIAVIDYGTKRNILRSLSDLGCEVVVLPYSFSAEEVLGFRPDGIVLSPGPGNPELLEKGVETVRGLIDKVPVMGVCLGQHLLALAVGAKTYKLKFGHRGGNHPVKDLETGKVYITSQNHGFAADPDSLKGTGLEVSQINLNDSTVEAVHHRSFPAMSLQYHPEACPGPLDNHNSFKKFVEVVKSTGGKQS
ncbi:MAG: carbamoyl phosphate synthase small subunit, partial [Armatimonadetes bacterium]|nr:carbamoyl phosphate synthase small subunit [Armatimonadota bacterium]NIM24843.1 carbamoyl phosphate synthase small subunit [Armatimonadota bacterium]NIM68733.1 carbamoyl phosphate synthase small subunit [Armatimonadota bacterium]NIM76026.1 carbamoyl phosphate synthase small subunit [Armatimonadota bacterium]NIN06930.1 carbamoyl phosphate synthase small subunit [Armatimonadota bacterium]